MKRILYMISHRAAWVLAVTGTLMTCHLTEQAGAAEDPAARQLELKRGDRIIFFGDSLTALAVRDSHVPEGKGYIPVVREALRSKGIEVDSVATGGHKVTNLLMRVDGDVLTKKPTVVVIQIGVNDANAGISPETFKAQLLELIGKLEKGGAKVIQCTCTCRIEGYNPENALDKKLDAFAEVARGIAREKKLPLVDLRQAFIDYWKQHNPDNKPKGFLTYDGNHWTETGHQYVAQQMLKKFK
jgi:lysophospholipase L1-like esterase